MNRIILNVFGLVGAMGCSITNDPGFDVWCGDTLCSWTVERGKIQKAPTWHERDYGVELVGPDVLLSQVSQDTGSDCMEFELVADVDEAAAVFVEVDFLADGVVEYSQRIPNSDWAALRYLVTPPTWYEGVKFIIRKASEGHAVLARVAVYNSSGCTETPIALSNRPSGATCDTDDECASASCVEIKGCENIWKQCEQTSDCGDEGGDCVATSDHACQ